MVSGGLGIMVSKYFRKAGVPQFDGSGNPILDESGKPFSVPSDRHDR